MTRGREYIRLEDAAVWHMADGVEFLCHARQGGQERQVVAVRLERPVNMCPKCRQREKANEKQKRPKQKVRKRPL